jgi:hypothetical protein
MNFQEMFKNHTYNSESFEYPETMKNMTQKVATNKSLLTGGQLEHIPNGGFPPIYECEVIKEETVKYNTKREYKSHKETISIQQLMASRRNKRIFIK